MDRISEPQHTGNVAAALTTCERPHMAYLDVTTDLEIWKPVQDNPHYEVSTMGRVRSLDRRVNSSWGKTRVVKGRVLVCYICDDRHYPQVVLSRYGVDRSTMVHRLVLETFVGPCPEGMECRHLNGDSSDNRLANLAWGTRQENAHDKIVHGTTCLGERNGAARLTEADVRAIRARAALGEVHTVIARDYGVARTAVTRIANRTRWSHVQ